MNKSKVVALVFDLILAWVFTAITAVPAQAAVPNAACVPIAGEDKPDASYQDTNCDGIDGDIAKSFFVDTGGQDGNPGTMALPFRTISMGIAAATVDGLKKNVLVATGTYNESIALADGVSLYGQYQSGTWARGGVNTTTISPFTPAAPAVTVSSYTATGSVEGFTLVSGPAVSPGDSARAIVLLNAQSGLSVRYNSIIAANGAAGSSGANGSAGAAGGNGSSGQGGVADASGGGVGGGGGGSSCSASGGDGGAGGYSTVNGATGLDSPASVAGTIPGGSGGAFSSVCGTAAGSGGSGWVGDAGTNGVGGSAGSSGVVIGSAWSPNGGTAGTPGTKGKGGAGGGGGGGSGSGSFPLVCVADNGGGGGGGGAGGCAGTAGTGGGGGGGSIAIMALASSAVISDNTISTGGGGNGGSGGAGGVGGAGGTGGAGGALAGDAGAGGAGGAGGTGGAGGCGGGGAGGISVGILADSSSTLTLAANTFTIGAAGMGGAGGGAPCSSGASGTATSTLAISTTTTPGSFSFTPQSAVSLSTWAVSNAITVTGISAAAPVAISGGEYAVSTDNGINWSAWSATSPAMVNLNDQIMVRQFASASYSTMSTATLTIGGVPGTFNVTTLAAPVNGVCGGDNGLTLSATPTNLCTAGAASGMVSFITGYAWNCDGINGGSNASCSASRSYAVTVGISGSGIVTSNPAGIDCGVTCSADFAGGSSVTLTAVSNAGSIFTGWSGACSGTAACTVTMDMPKNVTATFSSLAGTDLIPSALSTTATTVLTGTTLPITDTVQNQGASNMTAASIVVKYYLSTDATITAADKLLGQRTIARAALAAGASSTITTRLTVPATVLPAAAASGTYYIGAIVDATNAQRESNETNNTRASSGMITVRRAGVDLMPTEVGTGASSVMTGAGLTVTDTVRNQGASNMTATSIVVKYYLSTDASITATDKLLGQRTIARAAMNAGASSTASTTFTVPATLAAGAYHLGMIVDASSQQAENNETNNARADSGTVTVTRANVDLVSTAVGMRYTQIAAGSSHTVALQDDGTLWAWGNNATGQLGDGSTTQRKNPVQIGADANWSAVASGASYTLALKTDGTLWAWGGNASGQLGDGTATQHNSPVQVGTDTDWAALAAGNAHSVALKTDGTLWAWGGNASGQLGDGTTTQQNSPVQIGADTDWLEIAAGSAHTVALKADGRLWAWGSNASGQLGDGSTTDSHAPMQIGMDTDWATIAAGGGHTAAVKSTGALWTWGGNASGQLGDGTTVQRNSPVHIGTDSNWLAVAAGTAHTAAIKSTGALWAWGSNASGRLGDGTTINRLAPKQIAASGYADAATGAAYTAALKSDETLWAWGDNATGQLGDGSVMQRLVPIASIPTVAAGTSLAISDTVKHQGTTAMSAANITVKYYLSTDALISATDRLLGQRTVSALAAGASDSATTAFTIPLAVPSGTYYIGEIVDATNAQAESNEANNTRAGGKVLVHH